MRALFLVLMLLLPQASYAQSWATQDARLTTEEFLQIYFQTEMERSQTSEALNSFNIVRFLPSTSPSTALVFIVQTYNAAGHTTDEPKLRRELRMTAQSILGAFTARFGMPILKKRWSPSDPQAHLVIKHVRADDIQDVLAVTVSGETSFNADKVKEAAARVKAAGGLWSW